jgi:ATP-dependent RNA helicase DDX52/ROK1
MCIAPTGSGKTLAYILPMIVMLGDPARVLRKRSSEEEGARDGGEEKGKGIRGIVLVPTHDLAVQILGVVRGVTRGRGWRSMILSKATERSVCESSPGMTLATGHEGEKAENNDQDEAESSDQSTGSVDEFAAVKNEITKQKDGKASLGIDILIATPERLHHLVENGQVDLSQ